MTGGASRPLSLSVFFSFLFLFDDGGVVVMQRENGERLLMNQSKPNKNENNNVNENFMQREKK